MYQAYNKLSHAFNMMRNFVPEHVGPDRIVHGTFNQTGTKTGRLSAANPNLQQVPRDFSFREAFLALDGYELICADFAQQEPRIASVAFKDLTLMTWIHAGRDVYRELASVHLGCTPEDVSKHDRSIMKITFLGSLYGMSPPSLWVNLLLGGFKDATVEQAEQLQATLLAPLSSWMRLVSGSSRIRRLSRCAPSTAASTMRSRAQPIS